MTPAAADVGMLVALGAGLVIRGWADGWRGDGT